MLGLLCRDGEMVRFYYHSQRSSLTCHHETFSWSLCGGDKWPSLNMASESEHCYWGRNLCRDWSGLKMWASNLECGWRCSANGLWWYSDSWTCYGQNMHNQWISLFMTLMPHHNWRIRGKSYGNDGVNANKGRGSRKHWWVVHALGDEDG